MLLVVREGLSLRIWISTEHLIAYIQVQSNKSCCYLMCNDRSWFFSTWWVENDKATGRFGR